MNNGKKRNIIALLIGLFSILMLAGCGSNDDFEDTLNSGLEKNQSGETMTKQEYNAVKSFNDWRDKQTDKTYDQWDN